MTIDELMAENDKLWARLDEAEQVISEVRACKHGCDLCDDHETATMLVVRRPSAAPALHDAPAPATITLSKGPDAGTHPWPATGGFLLDEGDRYKPKMCPKCLGRKIDRQGRECRYCSWKTAATDAPPDSPAAACPCLYCGGPTEFIGKGLYRCIAPVCRPPNPPVSTVDSRVAALAARVAALEGVCHRSAEAGDERMDRTDDRVAALEAAGEVSQISEDNLASQCKGLDERVLALETVVKKLDAKLARKENP